MVSERKIAEFVQLLEKDDVDFTNSKKELSKLCKFEQNELLDRLLYKTIKGVSFFISIKGEQAIGMDIQCILESIKDKFMQDEEAKTENSVASESSEDSSNLNDNCAA